MLFYESAAVITTFVLLGRYMESTYVIHRSISYHYSAKRKANDAVQKLLATQPRVAHKLIPATGKNGNDKIIDAPIDSVEIGDTVVINPGERIPVDGVILSDSCSVDESMVTGESVPVIKQANATVYAGTINIGEGSHQKALIIKADKVGMVSNLLIYNSLTCDLFLNDLLER
jgi:P-type E1-E2 ATPase